MAVFNKDDRKKLADSVTKEATIIAAGTKIKGDISLSSSLHIDGEIEGIIHSDNIITIGPKGKVYGDIVAENLVINGGFIGSAESQSIEILSKGIVKGKLSYNELTIEKGSVFEGETILLSSPNNESNVAEISNHKKTKNKEAT